MNRASLQSIERGQMFDTRRVRDPIVVIGNILVGVPDRGRR